jgi:hypothetical protein
MPSVRALGAALLAMTLALPVAAAQGAPKSAVAKPVATPIIAEVFSRPEYFTGKRVQIYGLVVQAKADTPRFLLQDVSQMPLPVLPPEGLRVAMDSQLMVVGTIRRIGKELVLVSDDLSFVKVLAGGGCC